MKPAIEAMSDRPLTVRGVRAWFELSGRELEDTYPYFNLDTLAPDYIRGRYRRADGKKDFFFWTWDETAGRFLMCSEEKHKQEPHRYARKAVPHLYRIDEVLGAPEHEIVFLVEGEKCADSLRRFGLIATTAPGGAQGWKEHFAAWLAGRGVVILPDLDAAGFRYAAKQEESVQEHALSVVTLPPNLYDQKIHLWHEAGCPAEQYADLKGRDVADWLDYGNTESKIAVLQTLALEQIVGELARHGRADVRPTITVTARIDCVVDEAVAALEGRDRALFLRGGRVVRVRRDAEPRPWRSRNAPVIEIVSPAHVRDRLSRVANFATEKARAIPPPAWAGEMLLDRETLRFSPLEGIAECPTMRPDGSILQIAGYDAASGVILEPSVAFPAVSDAPTSEEVSEAFALLDDLFVDFPFIAQSDKAAAHAALFSVVARSAILGCVPLFAVRAPTPGTGKSLLCDVISLVATGREAARMGRPGSDEEMRKSLLAIALDGSSIVLLDNETGDLGSKELAKAITSEAVTDRLLGVSKKVTMPLRAVWFATGNNLTFSSDLARRVVPIDLDAAMENPEDRTVFRHPDLRAYVKESRPQLVVAVLTILRAYHVAGRPTHGASRIGSFESWDDLVRGVCVWAGLGDPEGGRERVRADDADTDALSGALEAVAAEFGDASFTAAEVARKYGNGSETFKAAVAEWVGGRGIVDARSIGNALRRSKGRIVGGRAVVTAGSDSHERTKRWKIRETAQPDFDFGGRIRSNLGAQK